MNNAWFGPLLSPERYKVKTPAGQACFHCKEIIAAGDRGEIIPDNGPIHYECLIRRVIGSIGHQKKTCTCYGGKEDEPPGLTKKQAAFLAYCYYRESCR